VEGGAGSRQCVPDTNNMMNRVLGGGEKGKKGRPPYYFPGGKGEKVTVKGGSALSRRDESGRPMKKEKGEVHVYQLPQMQGGEKKKDNPGGKTSVGAQILLPRSGGGKKEEGGFSP